MFGVLWRFTNPNNVHVWCADLLVTGSPLMGRFVLHIGIKMLP